MAKRIMIIDDEKDVRLYLKTLFEKNGYETETAQDGDEGYPKTVAYKPDLITLDILMPKESGISMYTHLKQDSFLKRIPVVIISGVEQEGKFDFRSYVADESIPVPDPFMEKPIDMDEFLAALETGQVISYNGGRYLLVELSPYLAFDAVAMGMERVLAAGFVPVLAHAERYDFLGQAELTPGPQR